MIVQQVKNGSDQLHTVCHLNPEKPTIIFLHGGPGVPSDFQEIFEVLKNDYQLITFHQRGTKMSPCVSKDYSMAAYLSDIECVAQFFKVSSFHLFGHSWGGVFAQIYAQEHGDKLLSLFLCSSGSGTNEHWKQTEKEVMQFNQSSCTFGEFAQMGINNLLGMFGNDAAYQRMFLQVLKNYNKGFQDAASDDFDLSNVRAEPINKTRPEIIKYALLDNKKNTGYPITILYGDQDIYGESKSYVIDRYPSATVHTLSNCGHLAWIHNPEDFTKIVKAHYL